MTRHKADCVIMLMHLICDRYSNTGWVINNTRKLFTEWNYSEEDFEFFLSMLSGFGENQEIARDMAESVWDFMSEGKSIRYIVQRLKG